MKKVLSLRTKAEVIIVACLLISVFAVNVMSVTRTITDTSDTIDTYIRNSNGNYWEVTEANLDLALDDVGTNGWISIGDDMTKSTTIDMTGHDGVEIRGNNHVFTMTADVPLINFSAVLYSGITDFKVIPSTTHTDDIILFHISNGDSDTAWNKRVWNCYATNFEIVESSAYTAQHNWTGVHFWMNNDSSMENNYVTDFYMYGAGIGIHLEIDGTDLTADETYNAFMNLNSIYNGYINRCVTGIWFDDDGAGRYAEGESGGLNSWFIKGVTTQATASSIYGDNPRMYGLRNVTGSGNIIEMLVYDWGVVDNPGFQYWIGKYSFDTKLTIQSDWDESSNTCFDEGYETTIESTTGNPYNDCPYDWIVMQNDTGWTIAIDGKSGLMGRTGLGNFASKDAQDVIDDVVDKSDMGSVFFKKGNYVIDAYIGASDMHDMTFIGEDRHSVIFEVDDCQLASGLFGIAGGNNITFKDMTFDGSRATDTSVALHLGNNGDVSGLTVDGCIFKNWVAGVSKCIHGKPNTGYNYTNTTVTDCVFVNNDYAIWFDSNNGNAFCLNIYSNNFYENTFSVLLDQVNYSRIVNNDIHKGGTEGISLEGNSSHNSIRGNIIEAVTGIELDTNCCSNIVKDNDVYLCDTKITNSGTNNRVYDNMGDDL